jgi:hypothetical protein
MAKKIFINGKGYSNLDEVPELPELFKKVLRDNNNNGMPDMMEKILGVPAPEDETEEDRLHAVKSLKQDDHIAQNKSYNQGPAPLTKGDNGVARLIFVIALVGIGYVLFQFFSGAWE